MSRLRTFMSLLAAVLLLTTAGPAFAQDPPADEAAAEEAAGDDAAAAEGEAAPTEGEAAPADGEAAGDDAAAADEVSDEDVAEAEAVPSPWSTGLILSMSALIVGGGSAVLGIWVDRDKTRPVSFAYAMSFLITCAVLVGVSQSYLDAVAAIQQEQDMERMLDMTYEIAVSSGDPELIALVEKEAGVEVEPMPQPEEGAEDTGGADTGAATEGEEGAEPSEEDVLAGDGEGDASTDDAN